MPIVGLRLSKFVLILGLISSVGWHWVVLQSVAWVGMAIHYSQSAPLREALIKTFGGNNPCGICKFVAEGKKSQDKQETWKPLHKLDLFSPRQYLSLEPLAQYPLAGSGIAELIQRPEFPPTPPPRVV
jgi:hypothetical protein